MLYPEHGDPAAVSALSGDKRESVTSSSSGDWVTAGPAGKGPAAGWMDFCCRNYPFHLLLDGQGSVIQAGSALLRLEPRLLPGSPAGQLLTALAAPLGKEMPMEPAALVEECAADCVALRLSCGLLLKGAFAPATGLEPTGRAGAGKRHTTAGTAGSGRERAESEARPRLLGLIDSLPALFRADSSQPGPPSGEPVIFLGSPFLQPGQTLSQFGLALADLPLHDQSRDFVLLSEQRKALAETKELLEKASTARSGLQARKPLGGNTPKPCPKTRTRGACSAALARRACARPPRPAPAARPWQNWMAAVDAAKGERELLSVVIRALSAMAPAPLAGCAAGAFLPEAGDDGLVLSTCVVDAPTPGGAAALQAAIPASAMGDSSLTWVCADQSADSAAPGDAWAWGEDRGLQHCGHPELADSRVISAAGLSTFPDWEAARADLGSVWAQTIPLLAGPVVVGFVTLHYSQAPGSSADAAAEAQALAPLLRRRISREFGRRDEHRMALVRARAATKLGGGGGAPAPRAPACAPARLAPSRPQACAAAAAADAGAA